MVRLLSVFGMICILSVSCQQKQVSAQAVSSQNETVSSPSETAPAKPRLEIWVGNYKTAEHDIDFAYVIFPNNVLLQLVGFTIDEETGELDQSVKPAVVAAASYISSKLPGDSSINRLYWHDGSSEVAEFKMQPNGQKEYTVRKHTKSAQNGMKFLLDRKILQGVAAQSVIDIHQQYTREREKALRDEAERHRQTSPDPATTKCNG